MEFAEEDPYRTRLNKTFIYVITMGELLNDASTFALFIAFIFGAVLLAIVRLFSGIRE